MVKERDEDKTFEQELKGRMGWKCPCSLEIIDKKSSLREVVCKGCGKTFKTNRTIDLCFDCEKTVNES